MQCGSSSVGRASASQAEGREPEPRLPLQNKGLNSNKLAKFNPFFLPIHSKKNTVFQERNMSKNDKFGLKCFAKYYVDIPKRYQTNHQSKSKSNGI